MAQKSVERLLQERVRSKFAQKIEEADRRLVEKDGELAIRLQKEENDLAELELEPANLAATAGNRYVAGFGRGKCDKPAAHATLGKAGSLVGKLVQKLQPLLECSHCRHLQADDGQNICYVCRQQVLPTIYDHATEEQFRGFYLRAKLVELRKAQDVYASRGRELLKKADEHRLACAAKAAPPEKCFCASCA